MPSDLSNYKASVSEFYIRAVWLSCITTHNLLPSFVLLFRGRSGLPLALLLFLSPPSAIKLESSSRYDELVQPNPMWMSPSVEILSSSIPCPIPAGCALCRFPIQFLLHLAGDVHPNPGPKNTSKITALSIIHISVRRLKNKTYIQHVTQQTTT